MLALTIKGFIMNYRNLNSTDRKLVNEVAELWVSYRGDSEGITWCLEAIKQRIDELTKVAVQTTED